MAQATAPILDSTLADNPTAPAFVRYWTKSGHSSARALNGSVANDAVDGAYTAASRWHRMVASKREIQRADVDVGGKKNASAQIGQTNW